MSTKTFEVLGFASEEAYLFPAIVNLCVIRGLCPCRCVHCPVGILSDSDRINAFGGSTTSLELFKKIVDEMSFFQLSTLRIHGVGEPILWEDLPIAIKYAFDRKVRTWLFTSLCTPRSSLVEHLARSCNIIEVSANSYDPQDYMRTKGVDEFQQVTDNIKLLRKVIQKEDLDTRLLISRVESEDRNYDASFVRYWKESGLVDDAFIRSYHDYNSIMPRRDGKPRNGIRCLVHWARFNIDCDGKAILCFNELFRLERRVDLVLGDVNQQHIKDIWRSEKLNMVRGPDQWGLFPYKILQSNTLRELHILSTLDEGRPTSENQIKQMITDDNGQTGTILH